MSLPCSKRDADEEWGGECVVKGEGEEKRRRRRRRKRGKFQMVRNQAENPSTDLAERFGVREGGCGLAGCW